MPAPPPQDFVVTPDQLCVGLFVHLDLPWFSHPFSFNSFKIRTPEQIKTLRELGVRQFRYDPERSDSQPRSNAPRTVAPPPPPPPPEDPATSAGLASKRARIARLAERKRRVIEVEKAFVKAAGVMRNISKNLFARPKECLEEVGELVNQLVVAFLDQPEVALHVMGEHPGGEETYFHGLNTSILAMMLAKELGFERPNLRRGQFDADDAGEFPGKVRHRRLEPVSVMPADGAGQAFDEAGPVVPNDGQDKRDGRSIHGELSSVGVNTIGSAEKYSTAIFSRWQHDRALL